MNYETLKRLSANECDFVLGKQYINLAAKRLGQPKNELKRALEMRRGGERADRVDFAQAAAYDFLIELIALTYLLHKWGLLIFHLDNQMYGNWILGLEVDDQMCLIHEKEGVIEAARIHDQQVIKSVTHETKSALCALLLWLEDKKTSLEIIACENDHLMFDGNHISFELERLQAQQAQVLWVKHEFLRYKNRLEQLQKIFIENFGFPSGMVETQGEKS